MPNEINKILAKHRQQIIDRERRTINDLLSVYAAIEKEILDEINKLVLRLQAAKKAGREITRGQILRHEYLKEMLGQIQLQVDDYAASVGKIIAREQSAGIILGYNQTRELFQLQSRVGTVNLRYSPSVRKRLLETAVGLMGDGSPVGKHFAETVGKRMRNVIREEVAKAVTLGTDARRLTRQLRERTGMLPQQAHSIARTETNRVRRETTRQIYIENRRQILKWEWVASTSSRTCLICLTLDGKQFDIEDPFPTHPNCRCTMIAVVEGFEHPRQTGREWLAAQPKDRQREIIGKKALAAIDRGDIGLDDLIAKRKSKFGDAYVRRSLEEMKISK